MRGSWCCGALARRLCMASVRCVVVLDDQASKARFVPVWGVPPSDFADRRHDARQHQVAADHLVPSDLRAQPCKDRVASPLSSELARTFIAVTILIMSTEAGAFSGLRSVRGPLSRYEAAVLPSMLSINRVEPIRAAARTTTGAPTARSCDVGTPKSACRRMLT